MNLYLVDSRAGGLHVYCVVASGNAAAAVRLADTFWRSPARGHRQAVLLALGIEREEGIIGDQPEDVRWEFLARRFIDDEEDLAWPYLM